MMDDKNIIRNELKYIINLKEKTTMINYNGLSCIARKNKGREYHKSTGMVVAILKCFLIKKEIINKIADILNYELDKK